MGCPRFGYFCLLALCVNGWMKSSFYSSIISWSFSWEVRNENCACIFRIHTANWLFIKTAFQQLPNRITPGCITKWSKSKYRQENHIGIKEKEGKESLLQKSKAILKSLKWVADFSFSFLHCKWRFTHFTRIWNSMYSQFTKKEIRGNIQLR